MRVQRATVVFGRAVLVAGEVSIGALKEEGDELLATRELDVVFLPPQRILEGIIAFSRRDGSCRQ
jgi:hypothetical protein